MSVSVSEESKLNPTTVFYDLASDVWYSRDKADVLQAAPTAICQLADLLLLVSDSDVILKFPDNSKYSHILPGATMKSASVSFVQAGIQALMLSYTNMERTYGKSTALLDNLAGVLEIMSYCKLGTLEQDYLEILRDMVTDIQALATAITVACHEIDGAFEVVAEVSSEYSELITYTHGGLSELAKLQGRKRIALEAREKTSRGLLKERQEHADLLRDNAEKDRLRFEKMVSKVPSGADVMVANLAQLLVEEGELFASLATVYATSNPLGLKNSFDIFKRNIEGGGTSPQEDKKVGESASDLKQRLKQLASIAPLTLFEGNLKSILDISTVEKGLTSFQWDQLPSVVKDAMAYFELEVEMMQEGQGHRDTPAKKVDDSSKPVGEESKQLSPSDILGMFESAIATCKVLSNLCKTRNSDQAAACVTTLEALYKSVHEANIRKIISSQALQKPILPSGSGKDTKVKREKGRKLAGDLALDSAIGAMKLAVTQLETSHVLVQNAIESVGRAGKDLVDIAGRSAGYKEMESQTKTALEAIQGPITCMSQIHIAFTGILCLFDSVQNVVDIRLIEALERLQSQQRQTERSFGDIKVAEYECKKMTSEVFHMAKSVKVMQDIAALYAGIFKASVQEGVLMIIKMQNLLFHEGAKQVDAVALHRKTAVLWADGAQKAIQAALTKEYEKKDAAIAAEITAIQAKMPGQVLHDPMLDDKFIQYEKQLQIEAAATRKRGVSKIHIDL